MPHRPSNRLFRVSCFALVFFGLQIFAAPLQAQTFVPLYQFEFGAPPNGGLIADANGNLYGTLHSEEILASGGDADTFGAVFELTNSGGVWSQNILYSFQGEAHHDGLDPVAGLIFGPQGSLLGTTEYGGEGAFCGYGCGTVFGLAPQAGGSWTERAYKFLHGGSPQASLVMDASGNIYGTAVAGSSKAGAVFEFSPAAGGGWSMATLYNFPATKGNQGTYPEAPVILDGAGNLYGTAQGGGEYKAGTAYRLSPSGSGWTFTALYAFGNSAIQDGANPTAGLVMDASGNLYGATTLGGTNNFGTIFELSPTPKGHWKETILHNFSAEDGEQPATSLIFDSAGNLWGVAPQGGQFNYGTIFELSPSGGSWNFNVVYSFANNGDGRFPSGPLLDFQGNLYGVSSTIAFELIP